MWPYWLLFFVPVFLTVSRLKPMPYKALSAQRDRWPGVWRVVYLLLVLMIGLRHEVGGDWIQYIEMLDSYADTLMANTFEFQDPAFTFLNKLASWSGTGVYLINLICAIIFSWGLVVFCRAQPRPWLALTVAVPYLITVVAMGYTRQGVAIGVAMVAMVAFSEGSTLRFMLWISLAALFHKSAIMLIPMVILAINKRSVLTLMWVIVAGVILFVLLLQEIMSFWMLGYIQAQYQSSGSTIRVAMNALPGALFLIFRKRFQLSPKQLSFWTWMAWSALLFIILLKVSPSSTAVDRLALYWIPLQLFVLSRLPNALGHRDGKNAVWVYAVVAYSAAVHFVWLVFADTAFAWLPYQFYPWIWLWL
jgi:hypothetical protein